MTANAGDSGRFSGIKLTKPGFGLQLSGFGQSFRLTLQRGPSTATTARSDQIFSIKL
jgi:hypothetical protein